MASCPAMREPPSPCRPGLHGSGTRRRRVPEVASWDDRRDSGHAVGASADSAAAHCKRAGACTVELREARWRSGLEGGRESAHSGLGGSLREGKTDGDPRQTAPKLNPMLPAQQPGGRADEEGDERGHRGSKNHAAAAGLRARIEPGRAYQTARQRASWAIAAYRRRGSTLSPTRG